MGVPDASKVEEALKKFETAHNKLVVSVAKLEQRITVLEKSQKDAALQNRL